MYTHIQNNHTRKVPQDVRMMMSRIDSERVIVLYSFPHISRKTVQNMIPTPRKASEPIQSVLDMVATLAKK